ncbi:MAG: efflux RND transporter periplasmic adaptor subunit [Chthonomonas sp.]|nr:efflux RND transporter periplasmic adaptor subunit [Chthonomonas sp.]
MRSFWILGLAFATLLAGCEPRARGDEHARKEEAHEESEISLDAEQQKLAGIQTETVRTQSIQANLNVPGAVRSTTHGRAIVTPPAAGRIVSLNAHIGQQVRQGQVLAVIESTELAQAAASVADAQRAKDSAVSFLKESKSQVQIAQAKLSSALANLARQKQFAASGAFDQPALQAAQAELNDAQGDLQSAQREQAGHAEVVRRLEALFAEGIVSRAELDAAKLELQQDEIRLARARAKIDLAKSVFEREKTLVQRGLANAREIQTAETDVKTSQLELVRTRITVSSAEAALRNANRAISNAQATYRAFAGGGGGNGSRASLVAPISGTITRLDVTNGQAVDRTQTLFEIENLTSVWVTANVPERDSSKVRKGARVEITIGAVPNAEFQGIVQVVSSRVDPKTRAIPVECLVTNSGGRLKPDMFGTVHIGYGESSNSIAIPRSALVQEAGKSFVFVKDDHGFAKREVTLGARAGNLVAVSKGLVEGETLVTKGGFVLASELKKGELKGHEH